MEAELGTSLLRAERRSGDARAGCLRRAGRRPKRDRARGCARGSIRVRPDVLAACKRVQACMPRGVRGEARGRQRL